MERKLWRNTFGGHQNLLVEREETRGLGLVQNSLIVSEQLCFVPAGQRQSFFIQHSNQDFNSLSARVRSGVIDGVRSGLSWKPIM